MSTKRDCGTKKGFVIGGYQISTKLRDMAGVSWYKDVSPGLFRHHIPQAEEKKRKYTPTAKHSTWQGVRPRAEERATPSAVVVSPCSSLRLYCPIRKTSEHPRQTGGLPQSLRKQKQIKTQETIENKAAPQAATAKYLLRA